ncbi:MAG: hypothetical protein M1136_10525 [Chloroflexi bacterium]|nr:hypothetical protein [Chloroflexota bacterium]MCL5076061.1 hypothetical protein [Chloroflexota bacterium]
MINRAVGLLILVALILLTGGCVGLVDMGNIQERTVEAAGPIYGPHTVGQTFISHKPRLSAIELRFIVYQGKRPPEETLSIHLRSDAASTEDLATVTVATRFIQHNAWFRFHFPALDDSENRSYYLLIDSPAGKGKVTVWASPFDVYPEGRRYIDGLPTDGDLAFRTYYDYTPQALIADIRRGLLTNGWLLLPGLALLLVPGYVLISFLRPWPRFSLIEMVALSTSLSVAVAPVFIFLSSLLRVRLDQPLAILLLSGLALAGLWSLYTAWRRGLVHSALQRDGPAFTIFFFLILIVSLGLRFLQVRDLVVPPWGDAVHHTLIAQLLSEQGAIPESYRPYLPEVPFTYHFGFHALAAFFHWLTGRSPVDSVLIVGQILNGLMVPAAFLFTNRLLQDRRAALVSALIVGLISVMPSYYLSWGRYTQLAGLVILPGAVALGQEALKTGGVSLGLTALLSAGLIFTHPRVAVFFLCFMALYVLAITILHRHQPELMRRYWLAAGNIALLTLALTAVWLWRIAQPLLLLLWRGSVYVDATGNSFPWGYFAAGYDRYLLILALAGLFIGLFKKRWATILIILWVASLFVLANPGSFGLPGSGMVNNTSVAITLFLPMALGAGLFVSTLADTLHFEAWPRSLKSLAAIALMVSGLWGAAGLVGIINPTCILAFKEDLAAIHWIKRNTPEEARFLINSYLWRPDIRLYMGSDGGYWITVLAQRQTTMPPLVYGLGPHEYAQKVNDLAKATMQAASNPGSATDELTSLLKENGIRYVYIGARGGYLHPALFRDNPAYQLVYTNQRVQIFALKPYDPVQIDR